MGEAPLTPAQRALLNLVLLAHAEIRALREVIQLMLPAEPESPVNAGNWGAIEAEFRRKHLEALNLPLDQFDGLLSEAIVAQAQPPGIHRDKHASGDDRLAVSRVSNRHCRTAAQNIRNDTFLRTDVRNDQNGRREVLLQHG